VHCPQEVGHFSGAFFMGKNRKHSLEFKFRLINLYLKGASIRGLSSEFGVRQSLLQKWVGHYQQVGSASLLPQHGRIYTKEFRQEAVLTYRQTGLSLYECCLKYKIPSESTLLTWIRQYGQSGINGFNNARGRPSTMTKKTTFKRTYGPLTRLEELERENLYLRAENEVLKKLEALAQQEQQEAAQRKKR
jgi:transposase